MKYLWIAGFLGMLFVAGCRPAVPPQPPVPLDMLQANIQRARESVEAVEQLQVQNTYQDRFQKAQEQLHTAERAFQEHAYQQAHQSALESFDASQQILQQFYQHTIAPVVQEAKTKIETISQEDPGNPLEEFLPALEEMLNYSAKLEKSQDVIDVLKVLDDFERVTEIQHNTQKTMKQTLESDVSFASGSYVLSEQGQQILRMYCQSIMTAQREFQQFYPNRQVLIKVHVVGYTDQLDFRKGTNLLKQLQDKLGEKVPQQQSDLRKALNQCLAELRAATISTFIVEQVFQADSHASIEQQRLGMGEDLPANLAPPYPLSDPRRRMCKIYTYILVR